MKTIILAAAALAVGSSAALAGTSSGTIKTGPYVSICSTNPKACGVGYDPLTRPHVPTTPTAPRPR